MSLFIAKQIQNSSERKIHIILDTTGVKQLEYKNSAAQDALAKLANEEWIGKVAVIIRDYQIQVHLNQLSTGFGLNWFNVDSLKSAIRSLQQSDILLQNVPSLLQKTPIVRN